LGQIFGRHGVGKVWGEMKRDYARVRVLLFASVREAVGERHVYVRVGPGATVADVRSKVCEEYPQVSEVMMRCAVAVNQEYAGEDRGVRGGDEVALIPPVSGGSRV